jgi:hypothetical protein
VTEYEFVKEKVHRKEPLSPSQFRLAMLGNAGVVIYTHTDYQALGSNTVLQWIIQELECTSFDQLQWLYGGW